MKNYFRSLSSLEIALFVSLIGIFIVRCFYLSFAMTHVDDINLVAELFIPNKGFVKNYFDLRSHNTGQWYFLLQRLLFRLAHDYESILFWHRLPSLVYWTAGLFIYYHFFKKYLLRKDVAFFLVVLGVLSWRGFIESSQSPNYTFITVLAPPLLYFFVSRYPLKATPLKLACAGYLLGALLWLNYSTFFIVAAGFVASLLWIYFYELRSEFKARLKNLIYLGLGYALAFYIVYSYHLKRISYVGVGGYEGASPPVGGSFFDQLSFIFLGIFNIIKNVLTFLPWENGASLLGIVALVFIILGLVATTKSTEEKKIRVFIFSFFFVWLMFVYFKNLPFSPSRHTYVFQFFVFLLLGYGLKKIKPVFVYGLAATATVVAILNFQTLLLRIENKVDTKYLIELADQNPKAIVMGIYMTVTWDNVLLTVERPDLKTRMLMSEQYWNDILKDPKIDHLILFSHRRPLDEKNRLDLANHGYKNITALREIDPVGSVELSSNVNGGNGFYVFDVRK